MNNKDLSISSLFSAVSRVFQAAIKFCALLLLGNILTPKYFGAFSLLTTISFTVSLFCFTGINQAASIYILRGYKFKNIIKNVVSIYSVLFLIVILGLTFFSSFFAKFLNVNPNLINPDFIIVLTITYAINGLIYKIFEGLNKIKIYSQISVILLNLPWITIFTGYLFIELSYNTIIFLFVVGNIASALLQILYSVFFLKIDSYNTNKNDVSISDFIKKSMTLYSSNLGFWIYTKSDIFVIQYFLGTSALGIFSLATKIAESIQLVGTSIGSVYAPKIASNIIRKENHFEILKQANQFILLIYVPIFLFLILESDFLISLFFNEEYVQAALLLKIYSVFIFFRGFSGTYSLLLDHLGFEKFRSSRLFLFAFLNLMLNIFVVQKFGLRGVCTATIMTYVPLILIYMRKIFLETSSNVLDMFANTRRYLLYYLLLSILIFVLRSVFDTEYYHIYIVFIGFIIIFTLSAKQFLIDSQ